MDASSTEDRRKEIGDRRKHSRSGRRAGDPDASRRWRRVAWLFAVYGVYLSLRSLPSTIKRLFGRTHL